MLARNLKKVLIRRIGAERVTQRYFRGPKRPEFRVMGNLCHSTRVEETPSPAPSQHSDLEAKTEAPENPTEEELIAETKRMYAEFAKKPEQDVFFTQLETDEEHISDRMNYAKRLHDMVDPALWKTMCGAGDHFHKCEPKKGDVVGDMGSGLGMDLIIASKLVGPDGAVYGFDFTEEMLQTAAANCANAGVKNSNFVNQRIDVPFSEENKKLEGTFDHIMSNGVFNLCTDKAQAMLNVLKLLKPGGKFCFSDYLILPIN